MWEDSGMGERRRHPRAPACARYRRLRAELDSPLNPFFQWLFEWVVDTATLVATPTHWAFVRGVESRVIRPIPSRPKP
jgi:hypothetical protein